MPGQPKLSADSGQVAGKDLRRQLRHLLAHGRCDSSYTTTWAAWPSSLMTLALCSRTRSTSRSAAPAARQRGPDGGRQALPLLRQGTGRQGSDPDPDPSAEFKSIKLEPTADILTATGPGISVSLSGRRRQVSRSRHLGSRVEVDTEA